MPSPKTDKLAVLIDADNARASTAGELLTEVSRCGTATIKRAYGDWTMPHLNGWRDTLHKLAIQPVQQFSYAPGKNATDAALIIDAMDVLHSGTVDGFCLVTSDSDFTRLAIRIRDAGLTVYGFGEVKTPTPFQDACHRFIHTETLQPGPSDQQISPEALQPMLTKAVREVAREDGWASLSAVGSYVRKNNPSFDKSPYGRQKLSDLVRAQRYLEVKSVLDSGVRENAQLDVRLKANSRRNS